MLTTIKNSFFKYMKNPIVIVCVVFISAITMFLLFTNKNSQHENNTLTTQQKKSEQVKKIPETEETKAKKKTLLEKINELNEKIAAANNQEKLDKLAIEKEKLLKEYQELEEQTT